VFVVASSRDDINPAEILFEFEGVRRDTAPRRETGKVTPTISSSGTGVSRVGFNCEDEWFIETQVVGALDTECGGNKMNHQTINSGHLLPVSSFYESSLAQYREDTVSGTIKASGGVAGGGSETFLAQPVAFHPTQDPISSTDGTTHGLGCGSSDGQASIAVVAPTLTASNDPSRSPQSTEVTNQVAAVHSVSMAVRRLTPTECERLQGFPDGYTNIPWRKAAESPDGPRYKALGNSWAVPVVAWIGQRIQDQIK